MLLAPLRFYGTIEDDTLMIWICFDCCTVAQILLTLLETAVTAASHHSNEELLLNVVAACTNITYYSSQVFRRDASILK
jgi:hypothetical protein